MTDTPPAQPQTESERLLRIVERLTEFTDADKVQWESAAVPNGWAVNVGQTRFRIYPNAGEESAYTLEFLGPVGKTLTSSAGDASTAALVALYKSAVANGTRRAVDPLTDVEFQLGLF